MHLKQPRFTYSACGSFTKNKERIQKVKETGDTKYIYRNELDKACFQHNMAHKDYKMDIEEVLLLWIINLLIKNSQAAVLNLCEINNLQMNFINQLLKKEKKKSIFIN